MSAIQFENRTKVDLPLEGMNQWLESCLVEGYSIKKLVYIFVSDEELLQVNKDHLDHDYYTDIISFDYTRRSKVKGECWISVDRITDHAKSLNVPFEQEFRRVVVHGLLHFMGFNDKSDKEQEEMTMMENRSLNKWLN